MADIDKALPNTLVPNELSEEVNVEEIEDTGQGPVEITDEEDGGATIDFDPNAVQMPDSGDPFANLNDLLPEDVLQILLVMNYKAIMQNIKLLVQIGKELILLD